MKKSMQKSGKHRGKKLIVCGAVLASLAAGLLSGCGGSTQADEDSSTTAGSTVAGTNTFTYEDEDAEAPLSTTLYAVVTAVDGSELTLAVSDTDFTAMSNINVDTDLRGGIDADGDVFGKGSSDGTRGDRSDNDFDPDGDEAFPDTENDGNGLENDSEDGTTDGSSTDMTVNSLSTTSTESSGRDTSSTGTEDANGNSEASEDSGSGSADGTPPEIPDGGSGDVPDDVPSGGMGDKGNMSGGMGGDAPSGGMPGDMSEMGEMPTDEDGDMEMPTNEDGDMEMPTDEDGEMQTFSDDELSGGRKDIASNGTDGFNLQTATLTIGDESVILVEIHSENIDADDAGDSAGSGEDADSSETEDADAADSGDSDAAGSVDSEKSENEDSEDADSAENTDDADSTEDEAENYESGTLDDMEVGSVLEIGFDEDGEISFILVTAQTVDTSLLESWLESSDGSDDSDGSGTEDGDNSADSGSNSGDVADGSDGGSSGGFGGGDMGGNGSSGSSSSITYEAVTEYTETTEADGDSFKSTGTDENAILVATADAVVTLNNITVSRVSSDSTGGDNSSFYGVGAAVLATSGTLIIDHAVIDTDAAGGAGVFSYGDAVVYVSDSDITTEQDTSGGIHVAGGGTLYAWDLTVETSGESSAAIRSDRGGGTMVVDGGTYTSNGTGSPAIYCTADISVANATLIANGSEAFCMEGLNTALLFDCDITGNMSDSSQNDTTWTFIVYQSMSGDSEVGVGKLQIIGGSITSENGGLFYTTNTESEILISDVDITYADDSEFFLMCTGNANERGWGSTGSNGADCIFTAIDQEMEGDVIWDSISTLEFYMEDGSTLTGAFTDDETWAGNGGSGYANVYISSDSTWIVTGDSTVTYLYNAGTVTDASGNTVSIVGSDGTVYVSGTGSYTITVDSYESTTDTVTTFDGALTAESWEDYEVEEP